MQSQFSIFLEALSDLDLTGRVPRQPRIYVGRGGAGEIFKGELVPEETLNDGARAEAQVVAIKSIRAKLKEGNFEKGFSKELYIWDKLEHINIVRLHGFIVEDGYPSLVLEWVPNGTVVDYVKEVPTCNPVDLVRSIANGIAYLHTESNVIHSDLKGANILVDGAGQAKLTDFGLSRMVQYSHVFLQTTTRNIGGSARWMSFELLYPDDSESGPEESPDTGSRHDDTDIENDDEEQEDRDKDSDDEVIIRHTKESDMWAFGMVIYEILTKDVPYRKEKQDPQVVLKIFRRVLPERPRGMKEEGMALWKICRRCWLFSVDRRLTIGEAVEELSKIGSPVQLPDDFMLPTKRTDSGLQGMDAGKNQSTKVFVEPRNIPTNINPARDLGVTMFNETNLATTELHDILPVLSGASLIGRAPSASSTVPQNVHSSPSNNLPSPSGIRNRHRRVQPDVSARTYSGVSNSAAYQPREAIFSQRDRSDRITEAEDVTATTDSPSRRGRRKTFKLPTDWLERMRIDDADTAITDSHTYTDPSEPTEMLTDSGAFDTDSMPTDTYAFDSTID